MSLRFEAGERIGETYRVVDQLGRGGMGVVLRAHDERLERDVAIKLIRPELVTTELRERFLNEARAMARVSHPNVLPIYAFGEHEGSPYFVTKIVHGVTVEAWLQARDPQKGPDLETAFRILEETCRGVAAIHAAGAIHRDLKPSNLLLDPELGVCVADMGVAALLEARGERSEIVGTPDYMAPECVLQTEVPFELAPRADVYALGCLAYELLTGSPPFRAKKGTVAKMVAHARDVPVKPSALRPDLNEAIDRAILEALAKEPELRTKSAEAFCRALHAAKARVVEPVRILIAEDDDDFRETLGEMLTIDFPDAVVEGVSDGNAALEAFRMRTPSVVLLDLNMPNIDGMQLTERLRKDLTGARVPIIVLTGYGGSREWKHLAELGADGFLVKPVNAQDLAMLVRRVLADRSRDTPLLSVPPESPREPVDEDSPGGETGIDTSPQGKRLAAAGLQPLASKAV
jgi:serine/threonine-protein kinase